MASPRGILYESILHMATDIPLPPPSPVIPPPPSGTHVFVRTMRDDSIAAVNEEDARRLRKDREEERIKAAENEYSLFARLTGKAHREVLARFSGEKEKAIREETERAARVQAEQERILKEKEEAEKRRVAEEERARQEKEEVIKRSVKEEDRRLQEQKEEEQKVREIRERALHDVSVSRAHTQEVQVATMEVSSPELASIEERIKGIIALKVADTISHQRKALAVKAVEIAEIAARREMMRAEVLGIIEAEKKALIEMQASVEQEEQSFAESEKNAVRQRKIRAEESARRAKSIATEKKRQADEAEEIAREKKREAEEAEVVFSREQSKAAIVAKSEEADLFAVEKRMHAAITFAGREISTALDHVRAEAAKITLAQDRARSADAFEKSELASKGTLLVGEKSISV